MVTKLAKPKKLKKKHKEKAKADEEKKEMQEAPNPIVTHVNNTLHSFFSSFELQINNQQVYKSNEL